MNKWLKRLSRKNFRPSKYSRICSIHFKSDDFVEKRIDSNKSRQRKKGSTLRNKILKNDAVSSVSPSYPSSYTCNETRRSVLSHSDIRRAQQIMQIEEMNESFLKNDQVTSVQQIRART